MDTHNGGCSMAKKTYRQGDVMLVKISRKPANLKAQKPNGGRHILALGETTGHAHAVLAEEAELLLDADGLMFLSVMNQALITHEEHDTITLPKGTYEV